MSILNPVGRDSCDVSWRSRACWDVGGDDSPAQAISKTDSSPWAKQQPYLEKGFDRAQQILESDRPEFYPGSTVTPFSNQTEKALQLQEGRALAGSPLNTAAQGEAFKSLSGEYLNQGNPAYAGMVERTLAPMRKEFQNVVIPGIESAAMRSGRMNSGIAETAARDMAADSYGRAMGDAVSGLSYKDYADERTRMQGAMAAAPQLAQSDYQDIINLGQVGAIREGKAGEELRDDITRHDFGQNIESKKLRDFMTAIAGGQFGGTQTSQVPMPSSNPWLTGAGLATTGVGAANTLFNPKYGLFGS